MRFTDQLLPRAVVLSHPGPRQYKARFPQYFSAGPRGVQAVLLSRWPMWAGRNECPQHLSHTGVNQVPALPKQLCELPEYHLGAAFGIPIYNFLLIQWDHFPILGVLMALPLAAFPSSSSHGSEHISTSRVWADWSHVSLWSWMACPVEYIINSCVCTHAVYPSMWQCGVCRSCVWIRRFCVLDWDLSFS